MPILSSKQGRDGKIPVSWKYLHISFVQTWKWRQKQVFLWKFNDPVTKHCLIFHFHYYILYWDLLGHFLRGNPLNTVQGDALNGRVPVNQHSREMSSGMYVSHGYQGFGKAAVKIIPNGDLNWSWRWEDGEVPLKWSSFKAHSLLVSLCVLCMKFKQWKHNGKIMCVISPKLLKNFD